MNRLETVLRIVSAATDLAPGDRSLRGQVTTGGSVLVVPGGDPYRQAHAAAALERHGYRLVSTDHNGCIYVHGWDTDRLPDRLADLRGAQARMACTHQDTAVEAIKWFATGLRMTGGDEEQAASSAMRLTRIAVNAAARLEGWHAAPCLDWPLDAESLLLLTAIKALEGDLRLRCGEHQEVAQNALDLYRVEREQCSDADARAQAVRHALDMTAPQEQEDS